MLFGRFALVERNVLAKVLGHLCACACCQTCNSGCQHSGSDGSADALVLNDVGEADRRPDRLDVGQCMNRFGECDTFFSTADAWVTSTNRPAGIANIAEQDGRAVAVSLGTFTAQFVQAVT